MAANPTIKRSAACVNFASDMILFRLGKRQTLHRRDLTLVLRSPNCFVIPDVKTNSTLLQTTLRADFALYFAENGV
jgi:hypothetical protein